MATHPNDPEDVREVHRQLKEALRDCDELLLRANRLLRPTEQDNEPPDDR